MRCSGLVYGSGEKKWGPAFCVEIFAAVFLAGMRDTVAYTIEPEGRSFAKLPISESGQFRHSGSITFQYTRLENS